MSVPAATLDVDVAVIGFGAAGGAAAIAAHDAGARVAIFEKMPDIGGLSIVSAGGIRVTRDADAAFAYLRATCGGRTPDDVLRVLADGMAQVSDWVRELARASDADVKVTASPGNYPLPGSDALGYCEVTRVPAIEGAPSFHAVRGIRPGCRLLKVLEDNVRARGIPVHVGHAARRLIRRDGAIRGVTVEADGRTLDVAARRGVVLACGGFENSPDMKKNFFQADPVLPASFLGNTGDGIAMAQEVGAALWHMWHYHGPYGFRHPDPDVPYGLYLKAVPMWHPGNPDSVSDLGVVDAQGRPSPGGKQLPRLAWILLDKTGRRFMDEYPPYPGDFGVRPLDLYDSKTQRFPRIPAHIVFDEAGRQMYPLGRCAINGRDGFYEWSADNSKEVELGLFRRFDTLDELATGIGVDPAILARTVAEWNAACATGIDEAHGRRPDTMVPLGTPPYYVGEVWPLVINTQGGPVHDARNRVLDAFGEPIPGLYAAGELGSAFGHLYVSGGNLAECMIGGRIAGREAAGREPSGG